MLALFALLMGLCTATPVLAQALVPTPVLRIELSDTLPQATIGSTRLYTFSVRNLVSGSDLVFSPRYRLTGIAPNFEGDTHDVLHASFLISDSVSYQLHAIALGRANFSLAVDYLECPGGGLPCVSKTVTQVVAIDVVAASAGTATPTGTVSAMPTAATATATPTASPATGLTFELTVSPPNPVVGDTVTFGFTVRNFQSGVVAKRPMYRLSGLPPNYEGDMSLVTHDVSIAGSQIDTVQFTLRAVKDDVTLLRLLVNYDECRGTVCVGGFSQSVIYPIVTRGSALTPVATPSSLASPTPTTTAPPGATATATPTASVATGLTVDLAVYPANPVVGDLVSFVFTVRNFQAGVVVQRPTYTLSGLPPNYEGDMSSQTHEVSITGPQIDTVQFMLRAAKDGITGLRLLVNYLECRGSQCSGGFSQSAVYPILTRGSALTPLPTQTAPTSPTPSSTPTSTFIPSPTVTPSLTQIALSTSTPTLTVAGAPTPTPTRTVGVVPTPVLSFDIAVSPPQFAIGDSVTVTFTIRNPQGPATLRRESYTVSGVSPNFDGNVATVTHDVAILGQQADVVTYTLRAVHEGVSLLQIQLTYEACAQTTPCPFGFAASQIFPITVAAQALTPTGSVTPMRTPTPTPTVPIGGTVGPTPQLTYELAVSPAQPFVGDAVTFVFTVRNQLAGTQALRPSYQVSGTSPNFEGSIVSPTHDVAIGGGTADVVTYQFSAVHEGTTLLQLHTSYDTCVNSSDPCSFGTSSSPIYRVVVRDLPTPTPTVTPTSTPSPSSTVSPTTTPDLSGTSTATPSPTITPHLPEHFGDGDCSIQGSRVVHRDGLLPMLGAGFGLLYLRRRNQRGLDLVVEISNTAGAAGPTSGIDSQRQRELEAGK